MKKIILGTRSSPLAMMQAEIVKSELAKHNVDCEIFAIKTTGDIILDKPLSEIGGKGLFAKELDKALLDGRCDIAVHSLKDVETELPSGTKISAVLPREDVRDVLISENNYTIDTLPNGAVVGTCSLRRKSQLLMKRPDVKVVMMRGNVQTRLSKIKNGEVDATFLALAGLNRLNIDATDWQILDSSDFIPAVGQGAIAIQTRISDEEINDALGKINCDNTFMAVTCERSALAGLGGNCKTPVGVNAVVDDENVSMTIFGATEDGKNKYFETKQIMINDAEKISFEMGKNLRNELGDFDQ